MNTVQLVSELIILAVWYAAHMTLVPAILVIIIGSVVWAIAGR